MTGCWTDSFLLLTYHPEPLQIYIPGHKSNISDQCQHWCLCMHACIFSFHIHFCVICCHLVLLPYFLFQSNFSFPAGYPWEGKCPITNTNKSFKREAAQHNGEIENGICESIGTKGKAQKKAWWNYFRTSFTKWSPFNFPQQKCAPIFPDGQIA